MSKPLNILQFCKKIPYPAKDGETLAINAITNGLYKLGHKVTVLAIETPKHKLQTNAFPEYFNSKIKFHSEFVNTDVKFWPALWHLFEGGSYNISRFYHTDINAKLQKIFQNQKFDVVQLEGIYLLPYLPLIRKFCSSNVKVVLRSHNVEFEIWERLAEETQNPLKAWYFGHLARRMKAYELKHINDADALVCITDRDADFFKDFGCKRPTITLPMCVDLAQYPLVDFEKTDFASVFFLGSLDWIPNQQGLIWFLEQVWPIVTAQMPQVKCYIAGRNAPKWLTDMAYWNVEMLGEVPNAVNFMGQKGVQVVPLFSGSGMRVKLIEAMALGKPIVATTTAAEGINCQHQQHILLADEPLPFANALIRVLKNKTYAKKMGLAARQLIENQYNLTDNIAQLARFYYWLLN